MIVETTVTKESRLLIYSFTCNRQKFHILSLTLDLISDLKVLKVKTYIFMLLRTSGAILNSQYTLHENCPYSEIFWSVFSRIPAEYWEILRISSYSVQMRENKDKKNSKYGRFLNAVMMCDV